MDNNEDRRSPGMPDLFDRTIGALHGLPDVTTSGMSTIRTMSPLIGAAQTFIVQTYRQREVGDHVFIECVSADGSFRLVLPPRVADAIARQRDALATKVRVKLGRAAAAERKARGEVPGFMKGRKKGAKRADS